MLSVSLFFKTRPVFGLLFVSLFFVWSARQRSSLSFSFFLSGAGWGNPNPCGLGFPLCFFVPTALTYLNPYFVLHIYI